MTKSKEITKSYLVSPWRRWIMAWVFVPIMLMVTFLLIPESPGAGFSVLLVVLPIVGLGH